MSIHRILKPMRRSGSGPLLALFLGSVGMAQADVAISTANSTNPPIGLALAALISAEHDAMAALPPGVASGRAPAEVAPPPRYDAAWLLDQPAAGGGREWECLSRAIYFEARGETLQGQFAVAEVVLNRVASPAYPNSVCAVVSQSGGGGCQFSYVCDGKTNRISEPAAWDRAGRIAAALMSGTAPRALTKGATHFHTHGVRPSWAKRFARTAAIGGHLFYRQPTRTSF
ncbi:MAG: cell wall hydrolase [Gemmobacter sp.]